MNPPTSITFNQRDQKTSGNLAMINMSGMPSAANVACFKKPPKNPASERYDPIDDAEKTMMSPMITKKMTVPSSR
jgi:hypothetical protein